MRESPKTERMHLPVDSTEIWLEAQTKPPRVGGRHRSPPQDSFEAWIEKRVGEALKREKPAPLSFEDPPTPAREQDSPPREH